MISGGMLRRLAHPIILRYWLKRSARKTVATRVRSFDLRVLPTVFHPKFFGSSVIFADFIGSRDLNGKAFLDMGTGSGIIGLTAARAGAGVTAIDINPQAVRCASENAATAGYCIDCRESDLFAAVSDRRFDCIAWNPPFFPKPAHSVAERAFFAGAGYAAIARFARESRQHLNAGGVIFVILSLDIDVAAVSRMFEDAGFFVQRVRARKWLGETMVVLEMR